MGDAIEAFNKKWAPHAEIQFILEKGDGTVFEGKLWEFGIGKKTMKLHFKDSYGLFFTDREISSTSMGGVGIIG